MFGVCVWSWEGDLIKGGEWRGGEGKGRNLIKYMFGLKKKRGGGREIFNEIYVWFTRGEEMIYVWFTREKRDF